jgi:ABC-type Fe3+-hydroxamate transport system substrate-binding protein
VPRPAALKLSLAAVAFITLAVLIALLPRHRDDPSPQLTGPPRIAALSPALAVILDDLKLSHLIVGRHSWDMVLDKSIPVCFDDNKADYERLLSVKPTHILLQLQSEPLPPRLNHLAQTHHWLITDFPILALDDIKTATTGLADLFSTGADKPLLENMDRAWSRRDGLFTGRVLLLAGLDPPSVLGPGSWHHQILERLGGTPAITEGSRYITLDAEDILHLKPDAIILILPRDRGTPPAFPTINDLQRQLGRLATLDIPAIHHSRLALIDNPLAHTPSTAMIGLADEMSAILQRWAR